MIITMTIIIIITKIIINLQLFWTSAQYGSEWSTSLSSLRIFLKDSGAQLNKKVGEPHSCSGRFEEEKDSVAP
jgi:hypothetical protein